MGESQKDIPRLAINITVTPEEYEFVRLKAYLNRTSMAGYLRRLIAREKSKDSGSEGENKIIVETHDPLLKPSSKALQNKD
jgi:hypothetical protein